MFEFIVLFKIDCQLVSYKFHYLYPGTVCSRCTTPAQSATRRPAPHLPVKNPEALFIMPLFYRITDNKSTLSILHLQNAIFYMCTKV
jgi:hypothetical protein